MSVLPSLIAVVGPVEPALLTAWVTHYRTLGIERFHLAFHFPGHVDADRRHQVQTACRALGIVPDAVSDGPWHEHTKSHGPRFHIRWKPAGQRRGIGDRPPRGDRYTKGPQWGP
ncbi:hypothetical protein [Streptomyces sp. A012304]|uniref:hypothetical protein n=1 Tax=Streptomyces sp. A012304 TaxID=375446 RepID=UPI00223159B9|nr:hypothetical protein [Streptomyces sp. A012304]GKQ38501.1 hypothetical protein ALMP_50320 [Streptomyces sp. A012304]